MSKMDSASVRVSFDPRCSTLLYALGVQALVCWSAWQVYQDATKTEVDEKVQQALDGTDWVRAFVSAHSMVHGMGFFITPVLWIESHRIQRLNATCEYLMVSSNMGHASWARSNKTVKPFAQELFGAEWSRKGLPGRKYRWYVVAGTTAFIMLPLHVIWWYSTVEFNFDNVAHVAPAQVYINVMYAYGPGILLYCCVWMRDFTVAVAEQLGAELSRGDVTAERVWEFRCCWTKLAALSTGLIATPVSCLMVIAMNVVLCTFHAYEIVVQVAAGDVKACDRRSRYLGVASTLLSNEPFFCAFRWR